MPAASPLQRLVDGHVRAQRHVEALGRLARAAGGAAPSPDQREAARAALHHLDHRVPVEDAAIRDTLMPALIESMAGSDAVCLRELGDAAMAARRDVASAWRSLRPALAALADGAGAPLDPAAVALLAERCAFARRIEAGELLPLAARLLDDAALAALARRLA